MKKQRKSRVIPAVICMLLLLQTGCSTAVNTEASVKTVCLQIEDHAMKTVQKNRVDEDGTVTSGQGSETGTSEQNSDSRKSEEMIVHVCGAVLADGVYRLPSGSRLEDAVKAAGGFSEDADREYLNLAECVRDGMQIRVPTEEEAKLLREQRTAADRTDSSVSTEDGRVNVNTAGVAELMNLPGIGEVKAKSIIEYREAHGAFQSEEDLKNVPGIKEKVLEQVRDRITY